jgi:hypothetical protein
MRFRHYKGGLYELVCEGRLEADGAPVIVYRGADGAVWVRAKEAFFEQVVIKGVPVPRFAPID